MNHTIKETVSREFAQKYYDFWGARYDWFSSFESRAKERAIHCLDLSPGLRVLNVGIGTGREHCQIMQQIGSPGLGIGVDISWKMATVAYQRCGPFVSQADGAILPFAKGSFDRLFCAYVLDLAPASELYTWLVGFAAMLKPGGRMVICSLTEGVNLASKAFVGLWKLAYKVSPISCGGCRPLQLTTLIRKAGFGKVYREVVVQYGVPSEITIAEIDDEVQ